MSLAITMWPVGAYAQRIEQPTLTLYGTPGIIEMPDARMQLDGTLSITGATKQPDDRVTISFAVTPWLEGNARYSVVYDFFGDDGPLYDRSLGFKLRLLEEGYYWPQVAVGMLDIGGTQIFGGEYIAASKKFGWVDATVGLGFGRYGSAGNLTNPLALVKDTFRERNDNRGLEETGQFGTNTFFRGEDVALYAGAKLETPVHGLSVLAEYSGDAYVREQERGFYTADSQMNFGLSYAPNNSFELGAGVVGGNEVYLKMSLRASMKDPAQPFKIDPPPAPVKVRNKTQLDQAIATRLENTSQLSSANKQNERSETMRLIDQFVAQNQTQEIANTTNTLKQASLVRFEASLPEQLAQISYKLEGTDHSPTQAVFKVKQSEPRPPLQCNELWQTLTATSLPGIQKLTFVEERESDISCTLIFSTGQGARAKSAPVAPWDLNNPPEEKSFSELTRSVEVDRWWKDTESVRETEAKMASALEGQKLSAEAIELKPFEIYIYLANQTYLSEGKAVGRAARAITHLLPASVENIHIILTTNEVNGLHITIPRTALERIAATGGTSEELWVSSTFQPARPGLNHVGWKPKGVHPSIDPIFGPDFKPSLFDPDDPFRFQVLWNVGANVRLVRGLSLEGVYGFSLYSNFDEIVRESNSVLPKVRSDFDRYLKEGESGLAKLQLTYLTQISKDIYGRLSLGYLEDMYGGVSAEVLYRPFGERWSFGAEVSQVWQRDFDRGFGFQDYNVLTGHLSAYWESPFYDIDLAVHAGRYLAKDYGATFEVMRRFDNGAEVGAFATFTDVSFEDFGEGSFDKGIRIVIPLDLMALISTQRTIGTTLRPLTRDGGARLYSGPRLYDMTSPVRYGQVRESWDDFFAKR